MRPLIFGEVLFDHFPDGTAVLGGAPFNVAWHLHAFGLKPLMISRIGNDELGGKVEEAMQRWGMDCSGMQTDTIHPTGTVQVTFRDGEPAYEIVDDVAYDFIDASLIPRLKGKWLLYHGSLALRHDCSATALGSIKSDSADTLFVDVNLRPPWWQRELVTEMMDGADWVKLNEQELANIYPGAGGSEERIRMLAHLVSEQIVLTGGEAGATAISSADGSRISVVPESLSPAIDTVGAGDAFCSVLVAGRLLNWPLEMSMQRAQQFASAVVGIRGAISQQRDFYRHFTDAWAI
ncbi:MAG: PfkB family carbohydrate kinase [Mariprofundaceae bacterium]|nr:PfkB family carbohydrate kinase [Mariprofundaceae bacterium]